MEPVDISPHPLPCVLLRAGVTGLAQPVSAQREASERTEEENDEKGVGNVGRKNLPAPNKAKSASDLEHTPPRWLVLVGIWVGMGEAG